MNKMEIKFDDEKILINGNLTQPEILYAAKMMELNVVKDMCRNKDNGVQPIISQLETMLVPFSEKGKEHFDQEQAMKTLPISLQMLVDYYKSKIE